MEHHRLLRSAGLVGGLTLISRGMGLIRDILLAGLFGTSMAMSAFVLAFRIPNLFRALFGEGALSAAFVPVFVETRHREGDAEAWRLARRVFTLVGLVLAGLVLLGIAGLTVALTGWEWSEFTLLTLRLTRIMLPYLFFICLTAVSMAALNSFHHFAIPALTPWLLNLTLIGAMLMLCPRMGKSLDVQIFGVAYAVLLAGALQWIAQGPTLLKFGWSPRPLGIGRDPRLFKMLALMGPVALGRAVTQVNVLIDSLLAAWIGQWAVAALYFSERLIYLPLGIFATALSTVLLPVLSGQAARSDQAALRETVARSLRMLMFVMIPAAVGLFVLSGPIVRMIFEWRNFTADSTRLTALALRFYAPGMIVFSLGKVFVPAFYAQQDTRTPVRVGVVTVGINIVLSIVFMRTWPMEWKHAGIAFATVVAETLNGIALAWVLHRRIGSPGWAAIGRGLARISFCAAGMGVITWWACSLLTAGLPEGRLYGALAVLGSIFAGLLAYGAAAALLRVPEARDLLQAFRRRAGHPAS
ncbi:MAG: murein biosynthesis integral membrane protein MurJ [Kiritimatiellia bacterium]|nr:murein biosynthesis integral membrane protein MurJ [Kiritimatiellia bacterium]